MGDAKRLVLVKGGGDWYDASVEVLLVAPDADLEAIRAKYRRWYEDDYCPALHAAERSTREAGGYAWDAPPEARAKFPTFWGFSAWVVKEGLASVTDYEEMEED